MLTKEQKEAFKKAHENNKYDCAFVGCVDDKGVMFSFDNTACHAALARGFGNREKIEYEA